MITLTTYGEARDAFRRREFRQALYDEGRRLMDGVIVNLHGDEHIARRRLENRLFRRDTFTWYEQERIPRIVDAVLAGPIVEGGGDLLPLARRTMMTLSIDVAGVDTDGGPDALDRLAELMERLARASTVAHATGDKQRIVDDGDAALAAFAAEFYASSLARRTALVEQVTCGDLHETELPRDVLTTLIRNHDRLDLDPATILREVAYFPWVGSHSTSAQLVHAMHHIFDDLDAFPERRSDLEGDDALRQRYVHESMRLHPASPVAVRIATDDAQLKSGRQVCAGDAVVIDVEAANRDRSVFGEDADVFDPTRVLGNGVAPWGLSFGHGTHACLGQELAAGIEPVDAVGHHLVGAVSLMAGAMLRAGARRDPLDVPTRDADTTRDVWGRYPVLFG